MMKEWQLNKISSWLREMAGFSITSIETSSYIKQRVGPYLRADGAGVGGTLLFFTCNFISE